MYVLGLKMSPLL